MLFIPVHRSGAKVSRVFLLLVIMLFGTLNKIIKPTPILDGIIIVLSNIDNTLDRSIESKSNNLCEHTMLDFNFKYENNNLEY